MNDRAPKPTAQLNCRFWGQWVALTSLGYLLSLFFIEVGERPDLGAIQGAIGGIAIGVMQASILKQPLNFSWQWVLACAVGWGLLAGSGAGAIGWIAPRTEILSIRFVSGLAFGEACGIVLGIVQWLVLRQSVRAAWRWICINPLCWAAGLSVGWTAGGLLRSRFHLFLAEVVGLGVSWAIVGATTGLALMKMMEE